MAGVGIHTQAGLLGSWASPPLLTAPKSPLDVTTVLRKASGDTQPPLLPGVLTLVPLAAARPPACPPALGGGHRAHDHQCRPSVAGHDRNQGIHGSPGQSGLAAGILCVSPLGPRVVWNHLSVPLGAASERLFLSLTAKYVLNRCEAVAKG